MTYSACTVPDEKTDSIHEPEVQPSTKVCSNCNATRPHHEFSRNKSKKGGLESRCKICESSRKRKQYKKKKSKINKKKYSVRHSFVEGRICPQKCSEIARELAAVIKEFQWD